MILPAKSQSVRFVWLNMVCGTHVIRVFHFEEFLVLTFSTFAEPTDVCFTSTVCSHRFHHGCIMDWLERRANTECPCCRTRLISDEEVWETVQKIRGERRRQIRKANRGQGLFPWFRRGSDRLGDEETIDPSPPPSPYRSFESGNVDNDAERDRVVVEENGLRGGRDS